MSEISAFIFDNFDIIIVITLVWCVVAFGWLLWRRKNRHTFPDERPIDVIFEERTASGRSHKNWYSKLGGAHNCLRIVVTKSELWITPVFPYSALADIFDLEHRISREHIYSVVPISALGKNSFLVHFRGENSEQSTIELMPRDSDQFAEIMRIG